ncbi:MAG: hypothetical protein AAB966_03050 [Patescibacteria group bacterium]
MEYQPDSENTEQNGYSMPVYGDDVQAYAPPPEPVPEFHEILDLPTEPTYEVPDFQEQAVLEPPKYAIPDDIHIEDTQPPPTDLTAAEDILIQCKKNGLYNGKLFCFVEDDKSLNYVLKVQNRNGLIFGIRLDSPFQSSSSVETYHQTQEPGKSVSFFRKLKECKGRECTDILFGSGGYVSLIGNNIKSFVSEKSSGVGTVIFPVVGYLELMKSLKLNPNSTFKVINDVYQRIVKNLSAEQKQEIQKATLRYEG